LGEIAGSVSATVDAENERKTLANAVMGNITPGPASSRIFTTIAAATMLTTMCPARMDCIDHSTTTTRLLQIAENRAATCAGIAFWSRSRGILPAFPVHWSAVIEEKGEGEAARFVVDSWFVDNGQPAVILPLDEWKKGAGPDV
jgi:hypothetical protein